MATIINNGERIDNIGFGDLRLIQKPEEFCYGIDAVLLANYAASMCKNDKKIMDLGTGTGVIPIILSHKTNSSYIRGLEVQQGSYERACRNIELNNLDQRLDVYLGNVADFESKQIKFDIVTANPPYFQCGKSIIGQHTPKAIARHEVMADLRDFMECASRILVNRGDFFMIHRPSRLVDIACLSRQINMEIRDFRLISPREGEAPNLILIHMIKNGGKELRPGKPMNVYKQDGSYTDEVLRAYERL